MDEDEKQILNDQTAKDEAIRHLFDFSHKRRPDKISKISAMTEHTSESMVNSVSIVAVSDKLLNMTAKEIEASDFSILGELLAFKEMNMISHMRKGRAEIVEISRTPEANFGSDEVKKVGLMKRIFTPRNQ